MTDLDLPQVSLTRYLELLRRRWWQVIPVTVIGLIVGAIAAFLIPRYYVAETIFEFVGGATLDKKAEQPMLPVVLNAPASVPAHVDDILAELGWAEAVDEDEERRRAFIESVRGRVAVLVDEPRGTSTLVNLKIVYLDTNGERSAEFTNALRESWIEAEKSRLVARAQAELDAANFAERTAEDAKRNAETDLANHRSAHGIQPATVTGQTGLGIAKSPEAEEHAVLMVRLHEIATEIGRLEGYVSGLETQIATGSIPPKITEAVTQTGRPEDEKRFQDLYKAHARAKRALENLNPGNENYPIQKARFEELEQQLAEAIRLQGNAATRIIDNPSYLKVKSDIVENEALISSLDSERDVIETKVAELDRVLEELPDIYSQLESYQRALETRDEELKERNRDAAGKHSAFTQMQNRQMFRVHRKADVPPRPTEPNILLVALAGSLIGLASAIGLILLLDFLQSSFKSVDDVERALPVPVLGTIAHLETFEERKRTVSSRRRISLAAGVFLFLSLSVVTVYFVAPTKLPPAVTNVLDVILGK